MKPIDPRELLDALAWRYATKVFDPARQLPDALWQTLQTALVLSPSSYGLQPYHFLVIEDAATRAELVPHSWGQKQVVDASHFLVFAARTAVAAADVDELIARTSEIRGIPAEALATYRQMMIGDLVQGPRSGMALHWAARQAYLALGNLLTSAALLGVDTCPMEGIDPGKYDEILGLKGTGWHTVVACAAGYRSPEDKYATLAKVRYPASTLIEHR